MRLAHYWIIAIALGSCRFADAYPQFQLSSDNQTCAQCHFSPVGGGLINEWGRSEASDTISAGGDGRFLHSAWTPPKWIALGADFRGVIGVKDAGADRRDRLLFPMQADIYVRLQVKSVSVYFASGACCSARRVDGDDGPKFFAREYFAMWQPKPTSGPYIRAGRFFTPFGFRHPDHTLYVRRDHGLYLGEETLTLSGGWFGRSWEVHAGIFAPDFQIETREDSWGGSALFEKRFLDDTAAWGTHAKVNVADRNTKYTVGGLGKLWLKRPSLLFLGEADAIVETFDGGFPTRYHFLGHLSANWFAKHWVLLGATFEHYDQDVEVKGTNRNSLGFTAQFFPRAHWEIQTLARYERTSGGARALLGMLMLHYYL